MLNVTRCQCDTATYDIMEDARDPVSLLSSGADWFAQKSGRDQYVQNERNRIDSGTKGATIACVGVLNTDPRHNNPEAPCRGITTIVRWARYLNGDEPQANDEYYSDVAGLGSKLPGVYDAVQIQTTKITVIVPIQ